MKLTENDYAGGTIPPAIVSLPIKIIATMANGESHATEVAELTARMARGEEAAFHEFYGSYGGRLLRYLFVVTGGREELAREALQLAFVRVARRVRRFETEAAFWNWLALLARQCVADELRKQTRYQNLLARFFRQRPAVEEVSGDDAERRVEDLLQKELMELPADERALLERKYLKGESIRTLAGEREMTEKAMESHLLRIRRKLKAAMLGRLRDEKAQ